jgi:hypothetical protein
MSTLSISDNLQENGHAQEKAGTELSKDAIALEVEHPRKEKCPGGRRKERARWTKVGPTLLNREESLYGSVMMAPVGRVQ